MPPTSLDLSLLLQRREEFKRFLGSRLNDPGAAEDVLQESLVKALQRGGDLREGDKLVPWFYRILRNAITDHVRSRSAARERETAWTEQTAADPVLEQTACRCFEALLPGLPAAQAELLRRVELEGATVSDAAAGLGITPNNASVTLHRARRALRARLELFCGRCSEAACLDCDCEEDSGQPETQGPM